MAAGTDYDRRLMGCVPMSRHISRGRRFASSFHELSPSAAAPSLVETARFTTP